MSRPATVPTWAETGTVTTPSAGKQAAGWVEERPAFEYDNWLMLWITRWIAWLAAGVLDGNWEFTGNVKVDGTTDLVGRVTAEEKIYNTSGYYGAAGAIASMPAGLTSPNPGQYTTAQSRQLNHLLSTDDASGATIGATTHTKGFGQWIFAANSASVYYAIDFLIPGDVITGFTVDLRKRTDNTHTFTGDIVYWATTGAGAGTSAETSATGSPTTDNSNAPGLISFGPNSLTVTVVAGRQYYLKLTPSGSVSPNADRVDQASVSWKHP